MVHARLFLYLALCLCLFIPCNSASGAIFRCFEESGAVLFSQFPCANAELVAETQVSVIKPSELSDPEKLTLKRIERHSRSLAQASHKRVKQQRRKRGNFQASRTIQCQQALTGYEELRAHKRGGYSLSESAVLDAREVELRRLRAQNC